MTFGTASSPFAAEALRNSWSSRRLLRRRGVPAEGLVMEFVVPLLDVVETLVLLSAALLLAMSQGRC